MSLWQTSYTIGRVDNRTHPPTPFVSIDSDFDEAFANAIAKLESYNKHHYRPNSYLHKWWARRCGSTFRLILKGLVEDVEQRGYYRPGGLEGKVILDPMIGGGTTLHEAMRLGASTIGVDIDPIPVLQARATLSAVPLATLEAAFDALFQHLQTELSPYTLTCCPECDGETALWFTLYGLRRRCGCGEGEESGEALFVDSLLLRQEQDGTIWTLCPLCGGVVKDGQHLCLGAGGTRVYEKTQSTCPACEAPFTDLADTPFYQRYRPLVIAARCPTHGLFLKSPVWMDMDALQRADDRRERLPFDAADFAIQPGRKSQHLVNRQVESYLDLFSSRQLLYLSEAIEQLAGLEPLLRLNLSLLVSTSLEFNSMLCGYKGRNPRRAGAVRHTFSHHAYAFPYTALEVNPVFPGRASGTLQKLFEGRIRRGRRWAQRPRERLLDNPRQAFVELPQERDEGVEVSQLELLNEGQRRFYLHQGSAARLPLADQSVDAIVTDPPYYDSVQYSDLSAFFRVWLRQMLPGAADWLYDETGSAVDREQNGRDNHYAEQMAAIFSECRRVLKAETGRLIFTFHHWRPAAWAALTEALYRGGFVLLNCYVVHAEHPMSVHITNMRSLTHDVILVLADRRRGERGKWQRPAQIRQDDSYHFCLDCGRLLGWLLEQDGLTAEVANQIWLTAIK